MGQRIYLGQNELPVAPSASIVKVANEACGRAHRYPEWDAASLRQALANYYHLQTDQIVTGGGSAAVIQQIMLASVPGEVIFGWPGFDAFPYLASGTRLRAVMTKMKNNAPDLDDMLRHITKETALIIVCTPNSPTGGIIRHDRLAAFLEKVPRHITVLIDEAYAEFVRDPKTVRSLEFIPKYENVIVSRTFSKAYGLAGFRVGYALAQPTLAEKVRRCGVPFCVPLPAQAAAIQALADHKTHHAFVDTLLKERAYLARKLRNLGQKVHEGHGNFVWLPVGEAAEKLTKALAERDIMVKVFPSHGIRITVGMREETDELVRAWQEIV